jgi:galactitol-specific phosphotransferase system IIB component
LFSFFLCGNLSRIKILILYFYKKQIIKYNSLNNIYISTKKEVLIYYDIVGDDMKKSLISIISCVLIGLILGKIMFDQYDKTELASTITQEKAYFFQVGVYSNLENMENATKTMDNYAYINQDDKYYVFLAITKNEQNKEKLKNYFQDLSIDIYIKEIVLDDIALSQNIDQYDILLNQAKTNDEIKSINKSVLATYEELKKND